MYKDRYAYAIARTSSAHNAADFYANVLHAILTPALADRQVVASIGDHMSPKQR
jgi:hypothetical protein